MRTHLLKGRKREVQVGKLGNMACQSKNSHAKREKEGEAGW